MSYASRRPTEGTAFIERDDRANTSSAGPMARSPGRGLLRVDEAAEWLGLSKRKTYELVIRGELPSVHIGRSRRIALSALENFVARLPTEPKRA